MRTKAISTPRKPSPWRHPVKARLWVRRARRDALARAELRKWADGVVAGDVQRRRISPWLFRRRRVLVVIPAAVAFVPLRLLFPASDPKWFVVALLLVVAAGTVWATRCPRHGRLAVAAVMTGCAWWAIPTRPHLTIVLWLTGTITAVFVRAWHFRTRPTPPPPDTSREDDWAMYVAGDRRGLPGTALRGVDDLHSPQGNLIGWQAMICGERGIHTWAKYWGARALIASAYETAIDQVILERLPNKEEHLASLKVVAASQGNPLLEVVELTETTFNPETGTFDMGVSADRTSAQVQVYDQEEGAKPVWLSGLQGTGKSGGNDTLLANVLSAGTVHPIIIDCKGGTSVGDWEDVCEPGKYLAVDPDNPEDVKRAVAILKGVRAVVGSRQRRLKGLKRYHPVTGEYLGKAKCLPVTTESAALMVMLEEAPQLFRRAKDAAPLLVREGLELGRAGQVIFVVVSQETTEKDAFANDGTIRKLLRAGTMVVYRNAAEAGKMTAQGSMGDVDIDPSAIPEPPGSSHLSSPVDRRALLRRTFFSRYPVRFAAKAVVPPLPADDEAAFWAAYNAHMNPPEPVEEPRPVGEPTQMIERERLRQELKELVWSSSGPLRTGTAVEHFKPRGVSDDAVQRLLTKLSERGDISDAGHGLWSRPLQEAVK